MICYASGGTLNLTQSALGNIQLASFWQFSLIHPPSVIIKGLQQTLHCCCTFEGLQVTLYKSGCLLLYHYCY